jgi:transcriptional regulator with XRE-family HTH domain
VVSDPVAVAARRQAAVSIWSAAPVRERLGANVRRARERSGFSQEDLARMCLVRRNTISRVEKGEQEPRVSTLLAFSRALGVPLDVLLSGLCVDNSGTEK